MLLGWIFADPRGAEVLAPLGGLSMEWRPAATVYCASDDPCVSLRAAQTVEALLLCGGPPCSVWEDESGEEKIAEVRMGHRSHEHLVERGCVEYRVAACNAAHGLG